MIDHVMQSGGETLVLRPGRAKWIALGVIFALLAAGAVLVAATSDDSGLQWLMGGAAILMGAGAILGFKNLQPGTSYLQLTPEGFAVKALFGNEYRYRWDEVTGFDISSFKTNTWVVFSFTPEAKASRPHSALRRFDKSVMGYDENLPDTYGMGASRLAALMNEWRERAALQ